MSLPMDTNVSYCQDPFHRPWPKPYISLSMPNDSLTELHATPLPIVPPPSPNLGPRGDSHITERCPTRRCGMLPVNQGIMEHITEHMSSLPINNARCPEPQRPMHEASPRSKALSVDTSPLRQVSSADENESMNVIASKPPSSRCSEVSTLLNAGPGQKRVTLPSWLRRVKDKRNTARSSLPVSEYSPQASPALRSASLWSTTPLIPSASSSGRAPFQRSDNSGPRLSLNGRPISSPLTSSSSIDAVIRPPTPNPGPTKAHTWPRSRRSSRVRPQLLGETTESNVQEILSTEDVLKEKPPSRFSMDSDPNNREELGSGILFPIVTSKTNLGRRFSDQVRRLSKISKGMCMC